MKIEATTPQEYIDALPEERKPVLQKLRHVVLNNIPSGFEECISYGMLGYVVPHSLYPSGYHCDPKLPLPFINLASQKNHVAYYHSGIYADTELYEWFVENYKEQVGKKPDMGKSCIRFKKLNTIPYELLAELTTKITVDQWIALYESKVKR